MKMKKIICAVMVVMMVMGCIGFSDKTYAEKGDLGEGYNLEIKDEEFEAVEGGTVNTGATDVVTILMFGKTDGSCINSTNMIEWFCTAPWINDERIRFVFVDYSKDTKENITSISQKYNCANAKFAYCPDNTAHFLLWSYADTIRGESGGFSIPLTVIKDADNKVQYAFFGLKTPGQIRKYVENLVGDTLKEPENPGAEKPEGSVQFYIEGTYNEEESMKVFELVNAEREKLGYATTKMDATLMKSAMQRAAECAVNYSHTRPNGEKCFTVLDDIYIQGCAENIAVGQKDAEDVMKSWMNSQGHRKNILNRTFSSIGVGCFEHDGVRYWVQLFSIVVDEEKTEAKNTTGEAVVTAVKGYYGKPYMKRGTVVVGKETKTTLGLNNAQGNYTFIPSYKNFTFESTDPSILTVSSSGAVTGVAPGEASVKIMVDNIEIGTSRFTVNPNPDQTATPPAAETTASPEPGTSEPPATNKPGTSEPPATNKPGTSEPPVTNKPGTSEPPATNRPGTSEPSASGQPGEITNIDVPTGKVYGDSDMDGVITLQDAQMALKVALRLSTSDEAAIRIMSGGGDHVELKHAQTILKVALKLRKSFYE